MVLQRQQSVESGVPSQPVRSSRVLSLLALAGALVCGVWGGPVAGADTAPVVVVALAHGDSAPGGPSAVVLPAEAWRDFVAESRLLRQQMALEAANRADAVLADVVRTEVDRMRTRINAFVDWRFGFFTTYRLIFSGAAAFVSGDDPQRAAHAMVAERLRASVLQTEAVRNELIATLQALSLDTARRRNELAVERMTALRALAAAYRMPATPALQAPPFQVNVVAEADALELPSGNPAFIGAGHPPMAIPDAFVDGREIIVLIGRQGVRRVVSSALTPELSSLMSSVGVDTLAWFMDPAAGAISFALAIVAEFLVVRGWDFYDRPEIQEAADAILLSVESTLADGAKAEGRALVTAILGPAT
jgi:hypothetical protein